MRLPKTPITALLTVLPLGFLAGAAAAQVPNGAWAIVDKNDTGTTAEVAMVGSVYAAEVDAVCVPFADGDSITGSAIRVDTDHPDELKLKKDKGEVVQAEKNNQPTLLFVTGSVGLQKTTLVPCEKIEIEADVNTKKTPTTGSFTAKAKNCDCPLDVFGTCDNFADQAAVLSSDCSSKKSVKFDGPSSKGIVKKITIKGKGDATLLE